MLFPRPWHLGSLVLLGLGRFQACLPAKPTMAGEQRCIQIGIPQTLIQRSAWAPLLDLLMPVIGETKCGGKPACLGNIKPWSRWCGERSVARENWPMAKCS